MDIYHKIQTVFKRDPGTNHKTLLEGEFSQPEFDYLQNDEWVFTEKVDGTNIRVIWRDGAVEFGGKTDNVQMPPRLLDKLTATFTAQLMSAVFETNPDSVCLYGEGFGAKIQKGGGNYRPDQGFVLFDVKIGDWWLRRNDVVLIANRLGIECVPAIGVGTLAQMVELARAGFNSTWGDFTAEGIVARPKVELVDRGGRRIITKIKHRDFVKPRVAGPRVSDQEWRDNLQHHMG